ADPSFWAPATFTSEQKRSRADHQLIVVGKLKPEVARGAAEAELTAITRRLEMRDGGNDEIGAMVIPLQEEIVGGMKSALVVLSCAIAFVLLIACANIANLQLARTTTRVREIAIRAALGASRSRIARQLLIESLTVSLAGGATGLLLSLWGQAALVKFAPA